MIPDESVTVQPHEIAHIDYDVSVWEEEKVFVGTFLDDFYFEFNSKDEATAFVDKFTKLILEYKDNIRGLYKIA